MQHIEATSLLEVQFAVFTPDDHAIYRAQVDRACPVCGRGLLGIRDCLKHYVNQMGPRSRTTAARPAMDM